MRQIEKGIEGSSRGQLSGTVSDRYWDTEETDDKHQTVDCRVEIRRWYFSNCYPQRCDIQLWIRML